jgi:5-methylthioribose kinase
MLTEAGALWFVVRSTPDNVPRIIDVDEAKLVMVTSHAPQDWVSWKQKLLSGDVNPDVGARLGELLCKWHVRSAGSEKAKTLFIDRGNFEEMRLAPFYRTVMQRRPETLIYPYLEHLEKVGLCFVHGDFSPKNVLIGPQTYCLRLIDFEVATNGDPAFDVASLLSHLLLKVLIFRKEGWNTSPLLTLSSYNFRTC